MNQETFKINISQHGSLLIKGGVTLVYPDGHEETHGKTIALCRCGISAQKPFCDGRRKQHEELKVQPPSN